VAISIGPGTRRTVGLIFKQFDEKYLKEKTFEKFNVKEESVIVDGVTKISCKPSMTRGVGGSLTCDMKVRGGVTKQFRAYLVTIEGSQTTNILEITPQESSGNSYTINSSEFKPMICFIRRFQSNEKVTRTHILCKE